MIFLQGFFVHLISLMTLPERIAKIPFGYSEVRYRGRTYGLRRTDFNGGKSTKFFAEELGGQDFISFNYYRTSTTNYLKPCEMPEPKVLDFLWSFKIIS